MYLSLDEFYQHFSQEILVSAKAETAILQAQLILENWLGYNPFATEYQEKLYSNVKGIILLSNYPVIKINSIISLYPFTQKYTYSPDEILLAWQRQDRALCGIVPNSLMEVNYSAGYEKLPGIFKIAFINLIKACYQSGDFDFADLYSPVKDVSSISLGGVSQSFRLGDIGNSSATKLDRLLQPIMEYRRKIFT